MSISFESYFGISPVRERQVTTYPVNVQAVLGFDPYKEVASLSIKLPSLPIIPSHMKSWSGITHLLELWQQAAKWTNMPEDKRKKAEWVWRNSLKRESTQQALLGCVEQLHVLREENSQLCPLLWAWWRITKLLEEGKSGMEFLSVWSASALKSPKMRRWFYQEVDQENILRRQVWPEGASSLLSLIRQFEDEARKLPDASSHKRLWEEVYSRLYNDTIERARFVQASAQRRIKERAEKYDLGVWLSTNLVEYLGLTQTSTSVIQNSLQAKTKLRKNSKSR
jgi:hypothetical protein